MESDPWRVADHDIEPAACRHVGEMRGKREGNRAPPVHGAELGPKLPHPRSQRRQHLPLLRERAASAAKQITTSRSREQRAALLGQQAQAMVEPGTRLRTLFAIEDAGQRALPRGGGAGISRTQGRER